MDKGLGGECGNGRGNILKVFEHGDGICADDFIGRSIAVLGIKGSGKTNTATVISEELLSLGIPVYVIDVEGEYWTLAEKYNIVTISAGLEHAHLKIDIDDTVQAKSLAESLVKLYVPATIDLSDYINEEYASFLEEFLKGLWEASIKSKKPAFILLEEAQELAPQQKAPPQLSGVRRMLARIAYRGRKHGLGMIMVSQRSAPVDKQLLTQAGYYFLHKVVHPIDMKVYTDLLPLEPKELKRVLRGIRYWGSHIL